MPACCRLAVDPSSITTSSVVERRASSRPHKVRSKTLNLRVVLFRIDIDFRAMR
jgi:hypothetical protein